MTSEDNFIVECPKCGHRWTLTLEELRICSCESGGVYATYLSCPECSHEQDLSE